MKAPLRRLPLADEHKRLGARMTEFAGWSMPLLYTSIVEEHFQVRTRAGLFDVSHMGKFFLSGPGALTGMQRLVASDLTRLAPGTARYTVLLTPNGGIKDDLIVYPDGDRILAIVNAATAEDDFEWISAQMSDDVTIYDLTEVACLFAVQGPDAIRAVSELTDADLTLLHRFGFMQAEVAGAVTTVMRTGYTGEDGLEILVSNEETAELWRALLSVWPLGGVEPCGLGARDTLRLEAGFILYDHDASVSTTPFEAGLGWLVDLDREDFVGREALLQAKERGPERLLVGLSVEAHTIPRTGDAIIKDEGRVGAVTSGSVSPVLGHPIAMGYVPPELAAPGTPLSIMVRGRQVPAQVVARPFYRKDLTWIPPHAHRHHTLGLDRITAQMERSGSPPGSRGPHRETKTGENEVGR